MKCTSFFREFNLATRLLIIKHVAFVIFLLCFYILPSSAQNNYSFRDRLFFGGNLGLMAGGSYTDIEVSPTVGYYITPRLSAGIGITYEYYNNRYHWYDTKTGDYERYETHVWGGRLFTNYVIINNMNDWIPLGLNFRIFAHAEYEALSYEKGFLSYGAQGREILHSFLVGGGLRFPMGKRSSMNLTVLWNLNSSLNNIYGSGPIIRMGFNF